MPGPIIAGAAALATNDKVKAFIRGATDKLTGFLHRDGLFIDARKKTFDALTSNGFPESEWGLYTTNVAQSVVPDVLTGSTYESTYGPYYEKLFIDVKEYLNSKRPGMGDFFMMENQRIAMELPASERFKGSPWNAVDSAARNYKYMNELMSNMTDGLNIGQAFVGQNGQIKIPNAAQAGEGVFSQLQNLGAVLLSPSSANTGVAGGQIMSQPAAGISGQQQIAASTGGVVLTGGVSVGGSVTKNTTSQTSGSSSGSTGMVVIAVVIAVLIFFGSKIKKLFS